MIYRPALEASYAALIKKYRRVMLWSIITIYNNGFLF